MSHVLSALSAEAARAAHVGDSRIDVETARAAGVGAWAVPWGYNAGEDIATAQPELIFDSLAAVSRHALGVGDGAAQLP
jgi:phosphoglycolate phosphatase